MITRCYKSLLFLVLAGFCVACSTTPPQNVNNVCHIFKEYPSWYWAARDSQKKWGVPASVQMAIMHQESRFNGNAVPPREKLLWVIPWKRASTSYGYTQALTPTWKRYIKQTGHTTANRTDFEDATDFVGWFGQRAHRRAGIPKQNAYALYLAYHEGIGGYMKGTYRRKKWLVNVAKKVQRQANTYHAQLKKCARTLPEKPWWHLW